MNFAIGPCSDESAELVEQFHYSRRLPSNIQAVGTFREDGGLFGHTGRCVAAIFFTIPPTRWSEEVWELARLVRRDDVHIPLTALISQACNHLRRNRLIDLLVSYADKTHGHHGGIYQAASWNYDGQREISIDGVIHQGIFVPGRSVNSRWGTRSPERLSEMGITTQPHFDEGKHLYWRSLMRSGDAKAKRLALERNPYPKPKISLDGC